MTFYLMQDGKPIEIKRSEHFDIKLTAEEKKQLREMRKRRSGSLELEIVDPYADFKAKLKAQARGQK